jgi:Xaa-Pro aminopeptidase
MMSANGQSASERRAALVIAEERASSLFDAIERAGLVRPGRTETEVGEDIYALAARDFGVEKHWHARLVRVGANTVCIFGEMPPLRTIEENDIVYIDLGPVFEDWEADIGRTYVLGDHPGADLVATLPLAFDRIQARFNDDPQMTGAELFAFAHAVAEDFGFLFGGQIAGHLVSEFAHAHIPGARAFKFIHPSNTRPLRDLDELGRERHWILEVHLVNRARTYGGFYERLL